MELIETRKFKLKQFLDENGGAAKVAKTFDLDASYLSQLINGHSSFGEKAARKIEFICKLNPYHLDTLQTSEPRANYDLITNNSPINKVPLLDMVQAGGFKEAFEDLESCDYIYTQAKVKKNTYALKVVGDSMTPEFEEGAIIIVEPELAAISGDFVIAKNGDNEATFKQLIKDGPDWYLKPLNPRYPMKTANDVTIVGVVIQSQLVTNYKKL